MRCLPSLILVLLIAADLFAQSPHGKSLIYDCSDCHNSDSWKIQISMITFSHSKTNFPLVGQHKTVTCRMCHSSLVFSDAKKECYSCHKDIHQNTVSKDCSGCHTPQTWLVSNVNEIHSKSRFPFLGKHINQDCSQCHLNYSTLNFKVQGIECYDCHRKDYEATNDPNHVTGKFSTDCKTCHNLTSMRWTAANIVHDFFPLTGGHSIANCQGCHRVGTFKGLSKECYTCHKNTYEQAKNPSHLLTGISTDCSKCHIPTSWLSTSFSHSTTAFMLTGKHTTAACESCHKGKTSGTSNVCYSCHKPNYDASTNPNHNTANLPTTCEQCHSTNGWSPATFNHALTKFPLLGSHTKVVCQQCHISGYSNTSMICVSCHQTPYNNSKNPNHLLTGISTDCTKCHNSTAWIPSTFSHSTTAFVLAGKHTTAACESCHKGKTTGTSNVCYSCHKPNYDASTNPNHNTANLPTTCEQCHSTNGWSPATFNHALTKFPLLGSHTKVVCQQCHISGYSNISMICVSCHQTPFNDSKNPNHLLTGISTDCTKCHNSTAWIPSTFSHSTTAFVLAGKHTTAACESCHKGKTTGTSNVCYSCHKTNYDASTNPNHVTANLPTTCEQCHSTSGWSPATFDHSITKFPLTGKHTSATCISCHSAGYTNTPTLCYSCHQTDFTKTTNPNHTSASFPTTCADCHTTNGWTPATFDHDGKYFPIYSGNHKSRWNTCADCHNAPANYKVFTCIDCHEHNKTSTDNDHRSVANYTYVSSACYNCHPKGKN